MKELGKSIMTALFLLVLLTALSGTVAYARDTGKAVIKDYSAGNADLIEEVLEIETLYSTSSESVYVTRTVIYEGIITPPLELSWRETIDGVVYSGTLKISYFTQMNSQTYATYVGTLYME